MGDVAGRFGDVDVVRPLDEDDDIDIEDETLAERLWALTEMFPDSLRNFTSKSVDISWRFGAGSFSLVRQGLWIASTSFMVMLLPYLFEKERIEMEQEQQKAQRQMLLGPGAVAGAQKGGGGMGSVMGMMPQQG